jgi:hypothetical protein
MGSSLPSSDSAVKTVRTYYPGLRSWDWILEGLVLNRHSGALSQHNLPLFS